MEVQEGDGSRAERAAASSALRTAADRTETRPGRIEKIVDIDLPRPRNFETREQVRYFELITEVREGLREV